MGTTINTGLTILSQRSRATRRIAQYLLVFVFVQPIVLGIVLPTYDAWKLAVYVCVPVSMLWLTYDSIRAMLESAADLDAFRDKAYQRELRVETAAATPKGEAAEVFIQTAPDAGTDSTSVKKRLTPAEVEAYIKHNGHTMSADEIKALRDAINNKPGYQSAVLRLLNLTRKKAAKDDDSPSPTVELAL